MTAKPSRHASRPWACRLRRLRKTTLRSTGSRVASWIPRTTKAKETANCPLMRPLMRPLRCLSTNDKHAFGFKK